MSKDSRSPKKRTPRKGADVDSDSDDEINAYDDEGGQMIGDIYVPPPPPPPKYSGDSTGIRLIITYIENNDFKSYAGRQLLGPFHKSFTSIVGPNGSGKSNVIDSMLFVFGYRAQKLRSKKLSVLIHNSDTFPNCQRAEVTVHFALINDKGGNDFELIAGSEFKVSRTIHKDNSSYYAIDGRRVQFKEVSQLLQSHGVDLRYNRFLILQGEVEQIALMKPKAESENDNGMLEFLEDIIGCSRLKVPLFKLQERVEEKNVLRAEKLNRVKVVEKEKDSLLEARNEAVLFLETENQLAKKKNEFYQLQRAEAMEVRNEALSEYEKANEVYKEAMSKIEEVRKTKSDKETEVKLCHDKLVEISKKAEDYNESFKEAEKRDTEVRSKVKHTKAKGKKMEEDLNNEKKKLEDLMKVPEKCANEQEELSKRKEQLEEDKQKAEEHLSHVMGLIKEDTQQFQQKKD
ncbi:structural maintenance of chromosomes protein 4-like protein, partial [Leptotrombidium deliense]